MLLDRRRFERGLTSPDLDFILGAGSNLSLEVSDMALVRWEPVRELNSLQQEMNRLFSSFFETPTAGNGASYARRWIPAMDLVETGDEYVLTADLPGLSQDDINLEFEDNVLTVSGERKSEHTERNEGFYRLERAAGSFSRSLTLPEGVDAEAVK